MPNVVSTFAGIGGFDLAFERAGFTITAQIENNKHSRSVLQHHWPDVPLLGDIQEVTAHDLPGVVDVMVGGFPCKDLSTGIANPQGLRGSRSALYFEFVRLLDEYTRIVEEANPRWVVLENVPRLLTSNKGEDMAIVTRTLADLGFVGAWRVLTPLELGAAGTPQQRSRTIVVGHRGEHPGARAVLLDAEGGSPGAGLDHEGRGGEARGSEAGERSAEDRLATLMFRKSRRPRSTTDFATWVDDGRTNTLNCFDVGLTRTTHIVVQGDTARMLTPVEWERLQGFPDGWTDVPGVPESARYTMLGDALAVPIGEWVARRIAAIPLLAAA